MTFGSDLELQLARGTTLDPGTTLEALAPKFRHALFVGSSENQLPTSRTSIYHSARTMSSSSSSMGLAIPPLDPTSFTGHLSESEKLRGMQPLWLHARGARERASSAGADFRGFLFRAGR